jgi:hypothetical protein
MTMPVAIASRTATTTGAIRTVLRTFAPEDRLLIFNHSIHQHQIEVTTASVLSNK